MKVIFNKYRMCKAEKHLNYLKRLVIKKRLEITSLKEECESLDQEIEKITKGIADEVF